MNKPVLELDLSAAEARVRTLAEERGEKPPKLLAEDRAPAQELLSFCDRHGLTLDYIFTGEGPKKRPQSEEAHSTGTAKGTDASLPSYFEAHGHTDFIISQIDGLLKALDDIASEDDYLGSSNESAMAMFALITVANEKMAQIVEAHDVEWKASVAERPQPA